MTESKEIGEAKDFWLFHDVEISELVELRKFIDPEIDISALEGIDELLNKLNHLLD